MVQGWQLQWIELVLMMDLDKNLSSDISKLRDLR